MEMRMERWMCGISLSDGSAVGCRIPKKQVRVTLGIDSISEVINRGRLR